MIARGMFLLFALGLMLELHLLVVRPWFLDWGATQSERRERLPGDELVPNATGQTTRAITIAAPADQVFGWVAQLGQDRAGFYSYDLLENLVGCEMPRIERFDRSLQHWQQGDKLWMYPPYKLGGVGGAALRRYEPGHVLAFATRQIGTKPSAPEDGSWSFIVRELDDSHSRLLVRGRGAGVQGLAAALFTTLAFEPIHFVMERRMLLGIATLAEGGHTSALADAMQVITWTLAFTAFITSGVLVLRRRRPVRHFATFVAAGALFETLTLLQPAAWIGAALVVLLGFAMFARGTHGTHGTSGPRGAASPPRADTYLDASGRPA